MAEYCQHEQMHQRVKAFFMEYEGANASSDVARIGDLYAQTFMFAGPNGVQVVKKEDFLKVVPKMKVHFASLGLSETKIQTVEVSTITSKYLLVNTAWKMTVRNSGGSKQVDSFATYILEQEAEDIFRIVFQIDHQDLPSVIKDQQNI
jgi:ketosteroid isomerase-like protein